MAILAYSLDRGEFADDFDASDSNSLLDFERRCMADDAEIARSASTA